MSRALAKNLQRRLEEQRSGTSIFLNFGPVSMGLNMEGIGYRFDSFEEWHSHQLKLMIALKERFVEVFAATIDDPEEPIELPEKIKEALEIAICPQPQILDDQVFNYGEVYFWLPTLPLALDFAIKLQLALYQSVQNDPIVVDGLFVLFYGSGFRQT